MSEWIDVLQQCVGFEWDKGNRLKSWLKHHVTEGEAEQVFFNEPLLLLEDQEHSAQENRLWALGHTDEERLLFITFTIRKNLIRVISARNMSKKEKENYEKFKTNPQI